MGWVLAARQPQGSGGGTTLLVQQPLRCVGWSKAHLFLSQHPCSKSLPEQAELQAPAWYFGRCLQLLCRVTGSLPSPPLQPGDLPSLAVKVHPGPDLLTAIQGTPRGLAQLRSPGTLGTFQTHLDPTHGDSRHTTQICI